MYDHLVLKRDAPPELIEMHLCERFGCLPSQLRREKLSDILRIIHMLDVIGVVNKKRSKGKRGR